LKLIVKNSEEQEIRRIHEASDLKKQIMNLKLQLKNQAEEFSLKERLA
jgi:hypothetical protein